ncbi:RIMS-binding protein 2 [Trichonephila clavipes]|nr:RIMS-binding protein 2 [Trichonephila clavipes]
MLDSIDFIELPGRGRCNIYCARYTYDPLKQSPNENPEAELALNAGDYVIIYGDMDEDGFFNGELLDGRKGLVPSNFVEKLTGEELFEFHATVLYGNRDSDDSSVSFSYAQDMEMTVSDDLLHPDDFHRMNDYIDLEDIEDIDQDNDDNEEEKENENFVRGVPPPQRLILERQMNKSLLIGWVPPDVKSGKIEGYHVYVDGVPKATIKFSERTRALIEGVDSSRPHRISVRSISSTGLHSKDAACTIVVGKDFPLAPTCVKASHISASSALISWLPSNSNFQHVIAVNSVEVKSVRPGCFRHLVTGLSPNTLYRVSVRVKPGKLLYNDEKNPKKLEMLVSNVEFRTLPKECGRTQLEVSEELGLAQSVISRLWQRFQDDGNVSRCYSTGRLRVTTPNEDRYLAVTAERNRRSTASDLSRQLSSATGTTVSKKTVYRRLGHIGQYACRLVRCVPLTATHCRLRLTWSAEFLFMDDNACPHRANIIEECLQSEDITRMDWPAYSPDLNPIEHVWDILGRRIAARQPPPTCLPKLWRALLDEWCSIPQDQIDNLILIMPRRCLPDPPVNVQVEQGPQDGTLLVTWLPVHTSTASTTIAPVIGYGIFAAGRQIAEVESPTGDHALIDGSQLLAMNKKCITVKSKCAEGFSSDSLVCVIPNDLLRSMQKSVILRGRMFDERTPRERRSSSSDSESDTELTELLNHVNRRARAFDPLDSPFSSSKGDVLEEMQIEGRSELSDIVEEEEETSTDAGESKPKMLCKVESINEADDIPADETEKHRTDTQEHQSKPLHTVRRPNQNQLASQAPSQRRQGWKDQSYNTRSMIAEEGNGVLDSRSRREHRNSSGQIVLDPDENLSDKEIYPPSRVNIPSIEITKDNAREDDCDPAYSDEEYLPRQPPSQRPSSPERYAPSSSQQRPLRTEPDAHHTSNSRSHRGPQSHYSQQHSHRERSSPRRQSHDSAISRNQPPTSNQTAAGRQRVPQPPDQNRRSSRNHSPAHVSSRSGSQPPSDRGPNHSYYSKRRSSESGSIAPVPSGRRVSDYHESSSRYENQGNYDSYGSHSEVGDNRVRFFVALFDYDPQTMSPNPDAADEELPFQEGQMIKVIILMKYPPGIS